MLCDYSLQKDGCGFAGDCLCFHKQSKEDQLPANVHAYDSRKTVKWNIEEFAKKLGSAEAKAHYEKVVEKNR